MKQLLKQVLTAISLCTFALPVSAQTCLNGGTDADIQNSLTTTGSAAVLCPNTTFQIHNTINFNAPNQSIYTYGNPTDSSRALLQLVADTNPNLATVIYGQALSGIQIHNIQVNGGRSSYAYVSGSSNAMIAIGGNASGQVVENNVLTQPRGWSTLHIIEGTSPGCSGATITYNTIGPAGVNATDEWADGVSLGCMSSEVGNNTITDATDGAIVVFGAPGSNIHNNHIYAENSWLFGGINMVDYAPYNGDYNNTVVQNNDIHSQPAFIAVGIAMGPYVWSCDTDVNYGGAVEGNTVSGTDVGYSYAVSGVSSWKVGDSTANVDTAGHGSTPGVACNGGYNASGAGFVLDTSDSVGTFQSNFVDGILEGVLGITQNGGGGGGGCRPPCQAGPTSGH